MSLFSAKVEEQADARAAGREYHGMSRIPEYRHWINMITRCENSNTPLWYRWGGRGISVYPQWRESFSAFFDYVGPKPGRGYSIDRIDNDGNYEPGNVRWVTQAEQARNTRRTKLVPLNGKMVPLKDAVAVLGLKYNTIVYRLRRGWTVDRALRP